MDNPVDALGAVLPKADNLKGHYKTIPHSEVATALEDRSGEWVLSDHDSLP